MYDIESKRRANKINVQTPKIGINNAKSKPTCDAFDDNAINNNNPVQNGKTAWNNNSNDVENRNKTPTPMAIDSSNTRNATSKSPLPPPNDAFANFEFPSTNEVDFFADFNSSFRLKTKHTTTNITTDAFGLDLNESHTSTKIETASGYPTDRCLGNLSHTSAFSTNHTALTNDTPKWNNGNGKFIDDHFDDHFGRITTITSQASTTDNIPPPQTNDINMNPSKNTTTKSFGFDDNDTSFADFDDAFSMPSKAPARIAAVFPTQHRSSALQITKQATSAKDCVDGAGVETDIRTELSTKFQHDYSKTDDFESDLQLVLQRSLVDQ